MHEDLLLHRPQASTPPSRLVLLFHGVGASAEDLRPLGEALAQRRPQDLVASVRAPDASDLGRGWQWFSVQGVTESNRPQRVAATLPRFEAAVAAWQRESGLGAEATTLVGFSQGAIMALQATQQPEPLASRVIAIAGRFAKPPRLAPPQLSLHLLHGADDRVMPAALASTAAAQWRALGGQASLDIFPGLGHGLDARVLQRVAELNAP